MRRLMTRVISAIALLMACQNAQAALLDFTFSFENALNGGGSITGIVRGLSEGTGAASSIEVFSNSAGYGVGEYVGAPFRNSWTVLNGTITDFDFLSFGVVNAAPAVTSASLFFGSEASLGASFRAGVSDRADAITTGSGIVTTEQIALSFQPAAAVPAPAALLLMGLAVFGLAARRVMR
ncbi:PEP-CTERM sorting domain-containing protein [Corallincola platygyrae]|uniref:PEP-CTERM sorting domain-containing protein n=1 Tax=Corallincola platygyrae TaxID=1193278 RepID=A0ABW4XHF2_9GAMM